MANQEMTDHRIGLGGVVSGGYGLSFWPWEFLPNLNLKKLILKKRTAEIEFDVLLKIPEIRIKHVIQELYD